MKRAGEIGIVKKLAPLAPPRIERDDQATPAQARMMEAAQTIFQEPGSKADAAYMHVVMCHLGMPRKRVPERSFERIVDRPGYRVGLSMEAGKLWDGSRFIDQPLPYGTKPRLVLLNVLTTAIRTKSRIVEVGHSQREFMLRLGINPQGSEYRSFKQQTLALAACRMQLGYRDRRSGNPVTLEGKPISRFEAWLVNDTGQQVMWPGTLELSQEFYDGLADSLVPVDERAVAALDGALEQDIYFWMAQRLCRVGTLDGELATWSALKEQFGQEYGRMDNFRTKFLASLRQVRLVYPDAVVSPEKQGLRLFPSKPPIPKTRILLSK
jgi:hypothetical protein